MTQHTYSVFITHGVLVQSNYELNDDELAKQAVEVLFTRTKEQLIGASEFDVEEWDEGELN